MSRKRSIASKKGWSTRQRKGTGKKYAGAYQRNQAKAARRVEQPPIPKPTQVSE